MRILVSANLAASILGCQETITGSILPLNSHMNLYGLRKRGRWHTRTRGGVEVYLRDPDEPSYTKHLERALPIILLEVRIGLLPREDSPLDMPVLCKGDW
jgi:hypothetical protein